MKRFISVEIEVLRFAVEDVVRTSNNGGGWMGETRPGDGDFFFD